MFRNSGKTSQLGINTCESSVVKSGSLEMVGRCGGGGHHGRLHGGGSIGVSLTGRRGFDMGSLGGG